MGENRRIVTKPGELIDFGTEFEEKADLRTGVPVQKGRVERVDYTTAVYEDGKTYSKYCYVYLPAGYDPEDRNKRYNVLYFQHGNTCSPEMFAVGGNKPMFDMLFDSGEREKCIIVFITYYFDPMGDAAQRVLTGMVPAGDGGYPGIPANYSREVVEDIIPTVELRYRTYLSDGSDAAIRATRDHRAFSGYSRGAVMTWRMLHECLPYFRWFSPMSCMTRCGRTIKEAVTEAEVIDYVTGPILAHPELPVFIVATNGGESDVREMTAQMKYLCRQPCFSYGSDPAKNNLCFSVSDYYHTDYLVPYYFWNSLKVLFRGAE